jgi:hypothetical protein
MADGNTIGVEERSHDDTTIDFFRSCLKREIIRACPHRVKSEEYFLPIPPVFTKISEIVVMHPEDALTRHPGMVLSGIQPPPGRKAAGLKGKKLLYDTDNGIAGGGKLKTDTSLVLDVKLVIQPGSESRV